MGRALLIMLGGLLVALSYIFLGMNQNSLNMTRQNVRTYNASKTKNAAHTGIQLAIKKYTDSNKTWTGPETVNYGDISLTLSLKKVKTDTIQVKSKAAYKDIRDSVITTFDISHKQSLVPDFVTAMSLVNGSFTFSMGGSSSISGKDASGTCEDRAGITVPDLAGVKEVSSHSGIDGDPPNVATVDNSIDFKSVSSLIDKLSPYATHISGNYKGSLGTADDPQITIVDSYTKLSGGIEPGYGIMVIRTDGELDYDGDLDIRGNLEYNGLVIFENAYNLNGRGTPNINGSVIVGYSKNYTTTDVDISGNIHVQYNCSKKKYADSSVDKYFNTTLFEPVSVYE